jgi:hypothetical protein
VLHRLLVLLAALAAALALAGSAVAITVHVRVEGLTTTIFGADEPLLVPFVGPLAAEGGSVHPLAKPTALGALEAASRRGEFFYRLKSLSFGLFVDRIGRYPSGGSSGWVYKVNGVSPPVGAADYVLRDGDRVLWYFAKFGPKGGPATLELEGSSPGCFEAVARDDKGKATKARDVVFLVDGKPVRAASGEICPAGRRRTLRAMKPGAIRSELVVLR